MSLQSGLITQESYNNVLATSEFKRIEKYNNDFLLRNKAQLAEYHGKWTNDSLHTWSRQYEYPYFFQSIFDYLKKNPNKKIRILDAGSGLTFFPYFLMESFENIEVVCTDYDHILLKGFEQVNLNQKGKVKFVQSDLRNKTFEAASFDIIYCVSVLEHTSDYQQIIENFNYYLVKDGTLALSFDVSLDGCRDIPIENAPELLRNLNSQFRSTQAVELPAANSLVRENYLTTLSAIAKDKRLSPWRHPYKNFLWCIKKFKRPRFYFDTALFCQTFIKD